jgi:hypothetical protein
MSEIANVDEDIKIIMSQTNYDKEMAEEKYNKWDGDYINVIKEYLNPNFQNKKQNTNKTTVNQKMMTEIRTFMDDVNTKYDKRVAKKKKEEQDAYLKQLETAITNAEMKLKNLKSQLN